MSVEQTKYGTYRVRWRDLNGRQRAKTFARKLDADRYERQVFTDLRRGDYSDPTAAKVTVRAWADQWLDAAMDLGQGGRDTYRRDLDRYILPELGRLSLSQLSTSTVSQFLADELAAGLAPSTVHRHYRTVRRMCQVAVDHGRLAKNPCANVNPPKVIATEMRFLTVAQVDDLAAKIGARYRAWVYVAAYAGLRWSELVGLRRGHVADGALTVTEQLVRRADGLWHRDAPKTKAGRRRITLPPSVDEVLGEHLATYSQATDDGLVFPNQNDGPLVAPSFTGNVFKPALERAGIDRQVRIHDLRHTAVALAVAAGAHPKAIQTRMGHASISVTLDRYGHLFPEMDERLALDLDALRTG